MNRSCQPLKLLPVMVVLAGLSACSTPPTAPAAPAATMASSATPAKALDEREAITGSRIPSKTTDRLLKTIDAAGAKEAARDQAPNPGPKFN